MRETCARVLAAALMTGAIATAMGLPTLFGSDADPGRRITAPPSSLQRSVRSPLPEIRERPHREAEPRSSRTTSRARAAQARAGAIRAASAQTRPSPRPAGAGKTPAPVSTPKPQPKPAPAPVPTTEPERELAASSTDSAAPSTAEPDRGKKPKGTKKGKAKSKAKPAEQADPADAAPPPATDCDQSAEQAEPEPANAEESHGRGADKAHGKKGKE
jgi:hypothetical protein